MIKKRLFSCLHVGQICIVLEKCCFAVGTMSVPCWIIALCGKFYSVNLLHMISAEQPPEVPVWLVC